MLFLAISLTGEGGIIRDAKTHEIKNTPVGEFTTLSHAIDNACALFECEHIKNGIISRGCGQGGFMIFDAQAFCEL